MPVTGQFNLISLDTIYLTTDGTEDGVPCKLDFPNGSLLSGTYQGATIKSANDTPYTFLMPHRRKGTILPIKVYQVMGDVLEAVSDLFDAAALAGDTIPMTVVGDTGDYNLEVTGYYADGIRPVQFPGKFNKDRIYDVTLNVVVAGDT